MHLNLSRSSDVAFGLILVGAVLLLSTLSLSWYTTSLGSGSNVERETFSPTSLLLWGSQSGSAYSTPTAYSAIGLQGVAALYQTVAWLILTAALLSAIAAFLLVSKLGRTRRWLVPAILVLAVVFALAAPVYAELAQPGVICSGPPVGAPTAVAVSNNNSGSGPTCGWAILQPGPPGSGYIFNSANTPGPQTSFVGANNASGQPLVWGPSIGWYMALVAPALIGGGALLYFRASRRIAPP